jgi:hypothetical protein
MRTLKIHARRRRPLQLKARAVALPVRRVKADQPLTLARKASVTWSLGARGMREQTCAFH